MEITQSIERYLAGDKTVPKGVRTRLTKALVEINRLREERYKLRTAAAAVVERWETPSWKDVPATAEYIYRLRDAIK